MKKTIVSCGIGLLSLGLVATAGMRQESRETGAAPVHVLVVYHSQTGNTRRLAEAVAEGARTVTGASVELLAVGEASAEKVLAADAIVVGSPVHNANVAPAVQEFINGWPFRGAPLRNRLGAAFVTAGGISAGEEATQLSILRSMLTFGMIVVGGPDWRQAFGASAVVAEKPFGQKAAGELAPAFLEKGRNLGKRVATLALRFGAGNDREARARRRRTDEP